MYEKIKKIIIFLLHNVWKCLYVWAHLEDVHFGAVGEVPFRVLGHHEDKDVVVELLGVVAGVGRGLPDELDGEALNHVLAMQLKFNLLENKL